DVINNQISSSTLVGIYCNDNTIGQSDLSSNTITGISSANAIELYNSHGSSDQFSINSNSINANSRGIYVHGVTEGSTLTISGNSIGATTAMTNEGILISGNTISNIVLDKSTTISNTVK